MDFLIPMLAVLALSLFFVWRFKLNSALAPFMSVALITLFMCFMGMLDLLYIAGLVVFALAVFALVWIFVVKKAKPGELFARFFSPGMCFFIASVAFFFIVLSIYKPIFWLWDEFSFWGTAAKNVFENNRLYTLFVTSQINVSYPPALPVWSYFTQFFARTFSEYRVYLAYDVMLMSAMSMLFARLKWKNFIAIPVLSVVSLAGLYSFWYSLEGQRIYMTAYADIQIGVMFGACLIAWFSSDERTLKRYALCLAALALMPLIKDIGLAFGLVAAVIMTFDMFISGNFPCEKVFGKSSRWLRIIWPVGLLASVLVSYEAWMLHFAAVTDMARVSVPYAYSAVDMLFGRDPYFNIVIKAMIDELFVSQLVTFGTVFDMLVVFTAIPLVIAIFAKNKRNAVRLCVTSVLLLLGFFAYYAFQAYAYAAIFSHESGETVATLSSYVRYVSSYPMGWMFALVGLCVFPIGEPRFKEKLSLVPGTAVCATLMAAMFYFMPVAFDQYFVTSDKVYLIYESIGALRSEIASQEAKFNGAFTTDDKIYYVCQDSDGGEWFLFNYQFQPAYTVKTLNEGDFVAMDDPAEGRYETNVDRAMFEEYLRAQEVDYVFVQKVDDYFVNEFGPMFSDGLSGFFDGTARMYKVTDDGTSMILMPVYNTKSVAQLREQFGY